MTVADRAIQRAKTILASLVALPDFEDAWQAQRARVLRALLLALFLVVPLGVFGAWLGAGRLPHMAYLYPLTIIMGVTLLVLLRRGRLQLVTAGLLVGVFTIVTGFVILRGVDSPNVANYILLIVAARMLASRQAMLWVAASSSLAVLAILVAQAKHWLPPPDPAAPVTTWVAYTLVFTFTAILMNLAVRGQEQAVRAKDRELQERRRTEAALRQLNDQSATLLRIGMAISELQDLRSVLLEVVNQLRQVLPVDVFYVALYDQASGALTYPLMYDEGKLWDQPDNIPASDSWISQAFRRGQPLRINRTPEQVEEIRTRGAQMGIMIGNTSRASCSILLAPLVAHAELIGVVSIQSYSFDAYLPEHLDFLTLAGHQIAAAVHNARLYDGLHRELLERERAEEEVRKLNAGLEERIQERTEQLNAAVRDLQGFSYSVSHDLRAPLRSIDGYSQLLLLEHASALDPDALSMLENIRKSTQRMGRLIDDLLNLARWSRAELSLSAVSLSDLAEEVIADLRRQEPGRLVEVVIQAGLCTYADPTLARVVLENLLGNAWKFTRFAIQPRIVFDAENQDDRQIFRVRDNGVGFDMLYAHKLFSPFQRLHVDEEFDGNGIGLANVRRIIERHGGRVWAEGCPGEGATFYFTLVD